MLVDVRPIRHSSAQTNAAPLPRIVSQWLFSLRNGCPSTAMTRQASNGQSGINVTRNSGMRHLDRFVTLFLDGFIQCAMIMSGHTALTRQQT